MLHVALATPLLIVCKFDQPFTDKASIDEDVCVQCTRAVVSSHMCRWPHRIAIVNQTSFHFLFTFYLFFRVHKGPGAESEKRKLEGINKS